MDDLKVIFYVVVAIAWMIYNNYKKVSEESRKRDPKKPISESPEENRIPQPKQVQRSKKQPVEAVRPRSAVVRTEPRPKLIRERMSKEKMVSQKESTTILKGFSEGGRVKPSSIVHFKEESEFEEIHRDWSEEIRNADFKRAFVLKEVLQRPFN